MIAVTFHEENIFFGPALIYAFHLSEAKGKIQPFVWTVAVFTILAGIFGVLFVGLPNVDAMCQRVFDAGGAPRLCEGVFPWLAEGFARSTADVSGILQELNVLLAVSTVVVVLMPLIWSCGLF